MSQLLCYQRTDGQRKSWQWEANRCRGRGVPKPLVRGGRESPLGSGAHPARQHRWSLDVNAVSFRDSLCSFLTGLGCPNCIEYFTSQGLQTIYHLQNLTIEVTAPALSPRPQTQSHIFLEQSPLLLFSKSRGKL